MKIFLVVSLGLISIFLNAQSINLKSGWQLKGTEVGFNDMNSFKKDCIKTVWRYNDIEKKWEAFSPKESIQEKIKNSMFVSKLDKINPNDGFWIFADNNCTIESNSTTHDMNLSRGLVAWYQFEGNAKDSSGNGNDGVEHGGVTYVDGVIGKAARFAGSMSEYIKVMNLPSFIEKISIISSVKLDNLVFATGGSGSSPIVTKGYEMEPYTLWVSYDHITLMLNWNSANRIDCSQEVNLSDNKYYLISATYDKSKGKIKLFLDGKKIGECNYKNNIYNNDEPLYIGSSYPGGWEYFKGYIDDIRIYNRALNEDEIKALYNMGKK